MKAFKRGMEREAENRLGLLYNSARPKPMEILSGHGITVGHVKGYRLDLSPPWFQPLPGPLICVFIDNFGGLIIFLWPLTLTVKWLNVCSIWTDDLPERVTGCHHPDLWSSLQSFLQNQSNLGPRTCLPTWYVPYPKLGWQVNLLIRVFLSYWFFPYSAPYFIPLPPGAHSPMSNQTLLSWKSCPWPPSWAQTSRPPPALTDLPGSRTCLTLLQLVTLLLLPHLWLLPSGKSPWNGMLLRTSTQDPPTCAATGILRAQHEAQYTFGEKLHSSRNNSAYPLHKNLTPNGKYFCEIDWWPNEEGLWKVTSIAQDFSVYKLHNIRSSYWQSRACKPAGMRPGNCFIIEYYNDICQHGIFCLCMHLNKISSHHCL